MCFFSTHGHFVLARNRTVLTSKAKCAAARSRPCGLRGAMSAYCGLCKGIISEELYLRLLNPEMLPVTTGVPCESPLGRPTLRPPIQS